MSNTEHLPIPSGISEDQFIGEAQKNEAFSRDESIIPFTRLLQPLSPQVDSVPEAKAGVFMNLASGTIDKELIVIPIVHVWNYTEWKPRTDDGGGAFIADWGESMDWQDKCEFEERNAYQPMTKDGHVIQKSRHFFIFTLQEDGTYEASILPFFNTGLKIARAWSSMMLNAPKVSTSKGMMVPAYFYYTYRIGVTENKNNRNQKWYLPKISYNNNTSNGVVRILDYPEGNRTWQAAIAFRESLKAGEIKAASQDTVDGDEGY